MYERTVKSLLELSPLGLTSDQLLWRLKRSGIRPTADEILQTLQTLAATGTIEVTQGSRWRLASFPKTMRTEPGATAGTRPPATPRTSDDNLSLLAIPATIARRVLTGAPRVSALDEPSTDFDLASCDWRRLITYYAATQRMDTRGRVDERADRHSTSWQLFRADGCWWEECDLRFDAAVLPASFREALMRRPEGACSVGYPVSVFDQAGLPNLSPALLLPATYRLDGSGLTLEIADSDPVINPIWLDQIVKRSRWQKDKLAEALFPEGEESGFSEVVLRLGNCLATHAAGSLVPGQLAGTLGIGAERIVNAAAIFLPTDDRFTRGAERDLDAIKDWPDEWLQGTALGTLLTARQGTADPKNPDPADRFVASPVTLLTDRQYQALASALYGPLTLIQGPPGTGKSEVILSLLVSIVLSGGSALVASKNHQALDEVERRVTKLVGSAPLLTRARDGDGDRDTDFVDQLRNLAEGDTRHHSTDAMPPVETAIGHARRFRDAMNHDVRVTALNLEISALTDRLVAWKENQPQSGSGENRSSGGLMMWVRRLLRFLRGAGAVPRGVDQNFEDRLVALKREQLALDKERSTESLDRLAEMVLDAVMPSLNPWAQQISTPTLAIKQFAADRLKALQFDRKQRVHRLSAEDSRVVSEHRPIWVVSTLSAGSRIPLKPALFDYVIFDEASQCDVASAIPLFARARKAVVVGDPMQLGFIPQLSAWQEHGLMDALGIGTMGRHTFAQSINSLFDFVLHRGVARWHFLADQFRSAGGIVEYLNDAFYQGRLVASQDERKAKWPHGYKPGLAWIDAPGRTTREEGGNVNRIEAAKIVELVADMVRTRRFVGSVGVVSPFNAQVALLMREFKAQLTEAEIAASSLRVATVDKFQGGEADVIIFSPVVADGAQQSAITFYERERRRLNVAISRARALCLVVGDKAFARRSQVRTLAFLAEACERPPKPRDPFDSEWERRLFVALKSRGMEPFPQYPVGNRFLDLALDPEGRKLDVEVDGRRWHADPDGNRKMSDRLRDRELTARGWTVRRFWVHELAEDMEKCLDVVERDLGRA